MLASAVFLSALGLYAWHRRSVPGALPFAITLLFATLWLSWNESGVFESLRTIELRFRVGK